MLTHPTIDKLETLRLTGMVKALREQWQSPDINQLAFEERLGLLTDREADLRETRRMQTRLKRARLRQNASLEDIDFKQPRGLDKLLITKLADCQWIAKHQNLIITGPTGVGKSYWPAPLPKRPAEKGTTPSMPESADFSKTWAWPRVTADTSRCWPASPRPTCWCWMTTVYRN